MESVEETFLMMENVDITVCKGHSYQRNMFLNFILAKNSHSQLILSEYCQISKDHSNTRLFSMVFMLLAIFNIFF